MGFSLNFKSWILPFLLAATVSVAVQIAWKRRKAVKEDADEVAVEELDKAAALALIRAKLIEELQLEKRKPWQRWNTALFFPPIRRGLGTVSALESESETPFESICFYFEHAVLSIQICALLFSEFDLTNIIQRKRNRGLLIQVITDHDTLGERNGSMNNSCRFLRKMGIPVRTKFTRHLMHNKFVIFDEEAVLTGSLNFTKKAIRDGTFENVVVTTQKRIVEEYIKQFRLLWRECEEDGGQVTGPSMGLSLPASNDSWPTFPV